jgi:hypothetical protein
MPPGHARAVEDDVALVGAPDDGVVTRQEEHLLLSGFVYD